MKINQIVNEFAPAGSGGGNTPRGPRTPGRDPWGGDDSGEDPYSRPEPTHYARSIDYFGRFEADHFDDEVFDKSTGVFKGYWDDEEGRVQIGYFKFDDPAHTGSDDPGMGWYYEPQNESVAEVKGELWRVMMPRGQGGHSERYYVVKGYGEDLEIWRSNSGAGDFIKQADAEAKADELNKGMAEGLNEMDKSAPQPGRDGKVSHSTYGSRDKKGSDYFKGNEAPGKPITKKQMEKDVLDILKKQGVAEGLDDDESVLYHFAEVLADELGYDADEVAEGIVSEMTTPSGLEVYSFTDDDQTYYMGVLARGKGSAIVSVSHAGGGQDNELEIYGPGENLKYVVKYGRTTPTLHTPDNKVVAQAKPGQDENDLVGVALDMLWGRMQQRFMEQDVEEGWKQNLAALGMAGLTALAPTPAAADSAQTSTVSTVAHGTSGDQIVNHKNYKKYYDQALAGRNTARAHQTAQQVATLKVKADIAKGINEQDMAEGKPKQKEADYGADYQDMVDRVKKLAGLGPLKTVWDPQKRVYKTVPRAEQPKK